MAPIDIYTVSVIYTVKIKGTVIVREAVKDKQLEENKKLVVDVGELGAACSEEHGLTRALSDTCGPQAVLPVLVGFGLIRYLVIDDGGWAAFSTRSTVIEVTACLNRRVNVCGEEGVTASGKRWFATT